MKWFAPLVIGGVLTTSPAVTGGSGVLVMLQWKKFPEALAGGQVIFIFVELNPWVSHVVFPSGRSPILSSAGLGLGPLPSLRSLLKSSPASCVWSL